MAQQSKVTNKAALAASLGDMIDSYIDIHVSVVDPVVTDDSSADHEVGRSHWYNSTSKTEFRCDDNTTGAAVWTALASASSVTVEVAARAASDATLTANLAVEATARAAADTTIAANLATEATARATEDTALAAAITAETSARGTAVSSEAAIRASADTALSAALTAGLDDVSASNVAALDATQPRSLAARYGAAYNIYAEDWGIVADGTVNYATSVVTGTDNAVNLRRMRGYLLTLNPKHVRIIFPPGQINTSDSHWTRGLMNLSLVGCGTSLMNVNTSVDTIDCTTLNVNLDYFWNADSAVIGYASGAAAYSMGELIATCNRDDTAVTLVDPMKISEFAVGMYVLLHGWAQSSAGYPINPRYYEVKKVTSISGGTVTFGERLRNKYRANWPDVTYGTPAYFSVGAARMNPLTRSTLNGFQVAEFVSIEGFNFIHNPAFAGANPLLSLDQGGSLVAASALHLVIKNCNMSYLDPTMCEKIEIDGCNIVSSEIDKVLDRVTFKNCKIGNLSGGGGGCQNVSVVSSDILNSAAVVGGRKLTFDDVKFYSNAAYTPLLMAVIGYTRLAHFKDCQFFTMPVDDVANAGYLIGVDSPDDTPPAISVVDGVGAFRVPYDPSVMVMWDVGCEIVCSSAFPVKRGVITDMYLHPTVPTDLVILADMNRAPVVGEVYKCSRIGKLVFDDSNQWDDPRWSVYNGPTSHNLLASSYHKRQATKTFSWNFSPWISYYDPSVSLLPSYEIHGTVKSITINVTHPYGGAGHVIYLMSETGFAFATIDMTVAGERRITQIDSHGSVGGDTLGAGSGAGFGIVHCEKLGIAAGGTYTGTREVQPCFSLVVEVWNDE
jgi:hypothetical protein